jgi:hypothetical protein
VVTGRRRAKVPLAARNFVVKGGDSKTVDMETVFALEMDAMNNHIEVMDGAVERPGGEHQRRHLQTSHGKSLKEHSAKTEACGSFNTGHNRHRMRAADRKDSADGFPTTIKVDFLRNR